MLKSTSTMAQLTEPRAPRVRVRCLVFLAAISLLGAGPTPEVVNLPEDVSLDGARVIELRVDNADIVIRVDDDVPPVLRARLPEASRKAGASVELSRTDRTVMLRRPAPASSKGPKPAPIRLELIVGSSVRFEVDGDSLGVQVEWPPNEAIRQLATGAIPEAGTLPAPGWQFRLRDSQARLVGIAHAHIEAQGGGLQLVDTAGALRMVTDDSVIESEGHAGYFHLDGVETEVEIRDLVGALEFTVDGGQLEAFEVGETIRGNAKGGSITIEGWNGTAILRGETTRMTVRRGAEGAKLDIGGRLTDLVVDDHGGPLTSELDGGALRAQTIFGPVDRKSVV